MKLLQKLKYHVPHIKHQLGRPLEIGTRQYRLQGYYPNRLAYDFDTEPFMAPVLKRVFAARPGAFLDVGANLGQTLVKMLAVDPDRTYVGFEPQLECCFHIEQFLRTNSLDRAQIVPVALSNANGMVPLFWDRPNDDTASIQPSHAYAPDQQRPHMSWVPARIGDELIREMAIEEIAAIKIDVEGFELEVLSGLAGTIRQRHPVILFEVLSNYFWNELIDEATRKEKSARADQIYAFFEEAGYAVHQLDGEGNEHRVERFELDKKSKRGNEGRDYIARPKP
jgi:FkbM family methyltransferase